LGRRDAGGDVKILVLEDNTLVGEGLIDTLAHLGHVGVRATTVEAAMALVERHDDVRVAMVDSGLKRGEQGLDFLHWLRAAHPAIARVLISGIDHAAQVANGASVQRFLKKPFGLAELAAVLESPGR
jgi:DNA-binding response OmpR family regulator